MTAIDEKPSLAERYSAATQSSDLRVHGDRRGDVDMMIASGKVAAVDRLGAAFYRLAVEFDTSRGEIDATRRWASQQQREANALQALAAFFDGAPADSEWKRAEHRRRADNARLQAKHIEEAASASVRTELALALVRMKSLREARDELGRLAVTEATRRRFMEPDHIVLVLAGRVLEHWLDPTCHRCQGRGFNGGAHRGELQSICRPCRGSGSRRDLLGQTHEQQHFCAGLRAEIDSRLAEVDRAMRGWLR